MIAAVAKIPLTILTTIKFIHDWKVCWFVTIFAFTKWIWKKNAHSGRTTANVRCERVTSAHAKKKIYQKVWRDTINKNRFYLRYCNVIYFRWKEAENDEKKCVFESLRKTSRKMSIFFIANICSLLLYQKYEFLQCVFPRYDIFFCFRVWYVRSMIWR